jgi:hypothetical protein
VATSSEDRTAPLFSRYQQLAKEHGLWLSLGVRLLFCSVEVILYSPLVQCVCRLQIICPGACSCLVHV